MLVPVEPQLALSSLSDMPALKTAQASQAQVSPTVVVAPVSPAPLAAAMLSAFSMNTTTANMLNQTPSQFATSAPELSNIELPENISADLSADFLGLSGHAY